MRSALVAHAPTRLDFGGGWTDVPPYPEERGGFVCNVAIERRATVRLAPIMHSANHPIPIVNSELVRAAIRAAGAHDVSVSLTSNFPVGAGLGGSSALGVALAAALAHWRNERLNPAELAEWSREVEVDGAGVAGGRQDHYAAAFGGALALTFEARVTVQPLTLSERTIAELESRCLLVYSGESRISGETITAVLNAYQSRQPVVVNGLERMAELARQMARSLEAGDIDTLGALLDEHWQHQRSLHPRITTSRIDAIEQVAKRAGAAGIKALGASGGGCVMVITPAHSTDRVAALLAPHGEVLSWRVARTGVVVNASD